MAAPRKAARRRQAPGVVLGCLLALGLAGCGSDDDSRAARALAARDLSMIVPWRAVTLSVPLDSVWGDDDGPPGPTAAWEAVEDTLDELKTIGARQVAIPAVFAWSVEAERPPGAAVIVYYDPRYRPEDPATWGAVGRTRRGDMGPVAHRPPASWDRPVPLPTPLRINQRAERALGRLLKAVARRGLTPILRLEFRVVGATSPLGAGAGAASADPSRSLDQFYRQYREHAVAMVRLAAHHDVAMVILGVGTPYVAGAGQARFADGSSMTERRELIREKWRDMVHAARLVAAQEGRPDMLFAYLERNVWREPAAVRGPRAPVWQRVPFWGELDAVGIGVCLTEGLDTSGEPAPRTVEELVLHAERQGFVASGVPSILDIRDFFRFRAGYQRHTRPVFVDEIECDDPLPLPVEARPTTPASPASPSRQDLARRTRLYQARIELARRHGADWLAGLGFLQSAWPGPGSAAAARPGPPRETPEPSTGFLDTVAEAHVRDYFLGTVARFGELVINPGFELGTAVPWSLQEWGGRTELRVSGQRVHAGRWALQITNPTAESEGAAVSVRIPVSPGVKYRSSAWLYLEDMRGGGAHVRVRWYGPGDRVIATSRSPSRRSATPAWVQEALDLTAPDDAVYARVTLVASGVGTAHLDDVSFRRVE